MAETQGKYTASLEMQRPVEEYALFKDLYVLESRLLQKKAGQDETVIRFFKLDSPPEITDRWVTITLPGSFVVRLAATEVRGIYSNDNQP